MVGKRKHEESELAATVHESRQFQVPGSKPSAPKKARNNEPPAYRKQSHASSVNAIKKRIRDVSRRLERAEDLPANVRADDERALAAYQQELAAAEVEKNRQKMIKKYHMVRFFERQKATRILKRLRKQLLEATSDEEVQELKVKMHEAEVDLNYTQFCPLSERYVSLYPQQKNTNNEGGENVIDVEPAGKPPMWAEVAQCMEDGTLVRLRNRDTTQPRTSKTLELRPTKPKPRAVPLPPDTSGMNRRERRSQHRVQEGGKKKNKSIGFEKNEVFGASQSVSRVDTNDADESDGGFFED